MARLSVSVQDELKQYAREMPESTRDNALLSTTDNPFAHIAAQLLNTKKSELLTTTLPDLQDDQSEWPTVVQTKDSDLAVTFYRGWVCVCD